MPRSLARLFVLLLLAGAACAPAEERAEAARKAATEALARADRAAALEAIRDLEDALPETPESILEVVAFLVEAGEAPRAVWILEESVARYSDRDDLRLALARAALLTSNASLARQAVLAIDPDSEHHAQSLLLLAQAELNLGNLDRGLEVLAEAERLYPDRPEARVARIATLLRERQYEAARQAVEEARETLDPEEHADLLQRMELTLAEIYAAQGNGEAAIASLHAQVERDPRLLAAWNALVQRLARAGRAEEALVLASAALEADPDFNDLYPLVATLYAGMGRRDEAGERLHEWLRRAPSPAAYVAVAEFYAAAEELETSLELLDAGLAAYPDDPMLLMSRIETLIANDQLEPARKALPAFVAAAPDSPHAEYLRARLELAEGDAEGAAKRLSRLMPDLDRAGTQYLLGRALEEQGDHEGARRRYGLAIAREPLWPPPHYAAIRLARLRGDWRAVASHSQRLLQRAPGLLDACVSFAEALVNLKEGAAAEKVSRNCAEIDADRFEPLVFEAQALTVQGRHDDAIAKLEAARERFGARPEIEGELALALGIAGRLQEGLTTLEAALALHPDAARLHSARAAILFGAGAQEEGARAVDRALELDPTDPAPLRIRCEFRVASGRLSTGARDCERYLEERPDDPRVLYVLGVAYQLAGALEPAVAAYRRAAELDPQAAKPRNNLAVIYAERGDLDAALEAASQAYALEPENASIVETLGWLYLRKDATGRAIALLEQAHDAAPEMREAQLHLAQAYGRAGRDDEARRLIVELRPRVEEDDPLRVELEETWNGLR